MYLFRTTCTKVWDSIISTIKINENKQVKKGIEIRFEKNTQVKISVKSTL